MSLEYTIGEVTPDELRLIFSSWCQSYQDATKANRSAEPRMYFRAQRAIIDDTLGRYPLLLAARAPNGVVMGWICAELASDSLVAHYVYVKQLYRQQRIATALLNAAMDRFDVADEDERLATHMPDGSGAPHMQWRRDVVERYGFEFIQPHKVGRAEAV